jgi:hypothetical protein
MTAKKKKRARSSYLKECWALGRSANSMAGVCVVNSLNSMS